MVGGEPGLRSHMKRPSKSDRRSVMASVETYAAAVETEHMALVYVGSAFAWPVVVRFHW